jgi:hypothetical protein
MAGNSLVDRFEAHANLPQAKATKPATVLQSNAVTGLDQTIIIRTSKHPAEGFAIFLQVASREDGVIQLVLPDKAVQAIYRQRDRLADRSTPQSRQKARATREAAKRRKARAEKQAKAAARNGG